MFLWEIAKDYYQILAPVFDPITYTVMGLSTGTPKIINFPFVPNGKLIIFRCTKIWAHYHLIIVCLNIGTSKNNHFPFGTNGKVVVLGVPILKHFRISIGRRQRSVTYRNMALTRKCLTCKIDHVSEQTVIQRIIQAPKILSET